MSDLEKDIGEPRRRIGGYEGEPRQSEQREEMRDEREVAAAETAERVREDGLDPEDDR